MTADPQATTQGAVLPQTLDLTAAAERLGVGRDWLARQARQGNVPHYLVGAKRLFTEAHLAAYLASREQAAVDPWTRTSPTTTRRRRATPTRRTA